MLLREDGHRQLAEAVSRAETAKIAEHPLLFTGNDFAQTDIPVALG
jgi:uncharacterized protein with PIN domain